MRKKRINGKVKNHVAEYEDNARGGGSLGADGGNNFADSDAGELRLAKIASSCVAKAFIIFAALIMLDYILTAFAIRQHFSEFNPLTVSIYRNFQNPEAVFFFFKSAVIGLNGLLVYLMLKLKSSINVFGKIALAYIALAAFFAFVVVVYDIGIITGAFALPDFANGFIVSFFRIFGMM
ncbi:MAG: hypothetical protein KKB25_01050 [Nanoarchaeota archaeon]|nr:hypothetical protein [Nanoarchaeota archaeon]